MNYIEELKVLNWCNSYIQYVQLRDKGLKKEAKKALDQFLLDFKKQDTQSRRNFIVIVNEIVYYHNNYNVFLPFNLYEKLINPEIQEWIKEEPTNPIPLIWTRDIDSLLKAIVIDPQNQITLNMLGDLIVNKISMNQHELTAGFAYDGNPKEDVQLIDIFSTYMENLVDIVKRDTFINILASLKKNAVDNI